MNAHRLKWLLAAPLLLAGCDEKAREFAAKTKAILDQRSAQISKKIEAETKAYKDYAALATEDSRSLVQDGLTNERSERAAQLTAEYFDKTKPVSLWRTHLSAYAQIDYEQNRQLLTTDLNASTLYLQRFEALKLDQDKVDALSKLLTALSKKPSLKDEFTALSGFVEDTKTEFDKKVCADLKSKTDAASKKLYSDKKCDDVLK
jgi:hypothetical protein